MSKVSLGTVFELMLHVNLYLKRNTYAVMTLSDASSDASLDVTSEEDEPVPGISGRKLVNGSRQ